MDNHHFMLKVCRLFHSSFTSCQFRALPDVAADSSITITKSNKILHENDHSSFFKKTPNPKKVPKNSSAVSRNMILGQCSDAETRKCPPPNPFTTMNPKKMDKFQKKISSENSVNHSSSSNGGWFTSNDEKTRPEDDDVNTFFSLSSYSGVSFFLKTSRRLRRCEEMKSIDETGRRSFSSFASFHTVPRKCSWKTAASGCRNTGKGRKKIWPENELGSAQLYYDNSRDTGKRFRRRKSKKSSSRRSLYYSTMIGESYAVEKSSNDPQSDFRASMVEMIVERQIFAAEDLERLLFCFLSLNAVSYHGIIINVFNEICQTLFTN